MRPIFCLFVCFFTNFRPCSPFSVRFMTLFNQKGSIFSWLSLWLIIFHGLFLFMPLFNQKGAMIMWVTVGFDYVVLFLIFAFSSVPLFCLASICIYIHVQSACFGIIFFYKLLVQEERFNLRGIFVLLFDFVEAHLYFFALFLDEWLLLFPEPHISDVYAFRFC